MPSSGSTIHRCLPSAPPTIPSSSERTACLGNRLPIAARIARSLASSASDTKSFGALARDARSASRNRGRSRRAGAGQRGLRSRSMKCASQTPPLAAPGSGARERLLLRISRREARRACRRGSSPPAGRAESSPRTACCATCCGNLPRGR